MERQLTSDWLNPRQSQEHLLQKILNQNKSTEYGKKYDFDTILSLNTFRERHPLTKYDHYNEYVDRMSRGESNVLMKKNPLRYALTSGSTGKAKMIPISPDGDAIFSELFPYAFSCTQEALPTT
jgi:phenylacetate-coenzyme A ligase PaaK-like adenylate-forming protein